MTDYKLKLSSAIATVAIVANAVVPSAFAGTTISISGNGADSNSGVVVNTTHSTSVNQNNTANFNNNIDGDANTGDNTADDNTGGDVQIKTGDASVNATVANSANQNWAQVDCCANGDTEVKISGNGSDSDNNVNYNVKNNVDVDQDNDADFDNNIKYLDAKSGNNDANDNTGGNVSVETGDASVKVAVSNWANANSARVGGGAHNDGSDVSLKILGNGSDSDNDIVVNNNSSTDVDQDNDADFDNNVDADANSGDNDADDNTGGEVMIETGDATVDVTVDNMANFNWADVNCGCVFGDGGLEVLVDGNGSDSDNNVNGYFNSDDEIDQDNDADFDNDVKYSEAETGNNDANDNTGEPGSDPAIETGDADVNVEVSNSANTNGVGGEEPEWPEFELGGINLSISFDLSDLLDALNL